MAATVRAFSSYTSLVPPRDELMHNIIAAQACRHAIVHSGGKVTERTLKQLLKVSPRTLKSYLVVGEVLRFSLSEVKQIMSDMTMFLERLSTAEPAR